MEMCQRERVNLQAGMNFALGCNQSAILMLVRSDAYFMKPQTNFTLITSFHFQKGRTSETSANIQPRLTQSRKIKPH
jgi:hypothetical protein